MPSTARSVASLACTAFALAAPLPALPADGWKQPPPAIARVVEAPPAPAIVIDPTRTWLLQVEATSLPPLADLARPMERLAGTRVDPASNGPHRPRRYVGLTLVRLADGQATRLALPTDADLSLPDWSHDGRHFAFTRTRRDGIELWLGDAQAASVRALTPARVNGLGGPFRWMPDGQRLLVEMVPEARGPAPQRPLVPAGPSIQQTSGKSGAVRTFQDLLNDAHDEALFDHYFTSELVLIDPRGPTFRKLGAPALFADVDPAPRGDLLLITRTVRPYSYVFPAGYFGAVTEVWDLDGKFVREVERHGVRDSLPNEGVPTGPRSIGWRPDRPATLTFAQALDGGDPRNDVHPRDALFELEIASESGPAHAASATAPREFHRTEHRFQGLSWLEGEAGGTAGQALVREYDRDRRWSRTWLLGVDARAAAADAASAAASAPAPRLLWDLSTQDRYRAPGTPITRPDAHGRRVVAVHTGALLLNGQGATPEGDRPFLDRLALADFATTRLWQCDGASLESVVAPLTPDGKLLLTRRETASEPANWFVRDLTRDAADPAGRRAVTQITDPAPELRKIEKRLVKYARADGVELSATLYLPPDVAERTQGGAKLPLLVWAYPREFNDPSTAGQVSGSPHSFTMFRGISHLFLLLHGYAVLDNATMPVVGPPETANDTFVPQIVASAQAALDFAASTGVIDPQRAIVGGHSYGAFMTAHLLAHCDLFRAGVARSGAYNRTLTPFGFQSERRSYWEAPEIYAQLSPFTHAPKINEPLLLIHGEMDDNQGTFPIQSERLFQAIQGHGGTARLVFLPFEAHGYVARESTLHTLAEMVEWADRYTGAGAARN
ncbi:MAG: S9 family peptidase [Planctomycetes bacterium]|nr:S9 family peptidase [Planctomycetota bacterium]